MARVMVEMIVNLAHLCFFLPSIFMCVRGKMVGLAIITTLSIFLLEITILKVSSQDYRNAKGYCSFGLRFILLIGEMQTKRMDEPVTAVSRIAIQIAQVTLVRYGRRRRLCFLNTFRTKDRYRRGVRVKRCRENSTQRMWWFCGGRNRNGNVRKGNCRCRDDGFLGAFGIGMGTKSGFIFGIRERGQQTTHVL